MPNKALVLVAAAVLEARVEEVRHAIRARFTEATAKRSASEKPKMHADVAAACERVSVEFTFIGFAEGIHRAIEGTWHSRHPIGFAHCPAARRHFPVLPPSVATAPRPRP
jgi:hypothetical protein